MRHAVYFLTMQKVTFHHSGYVANLSFILKFTDKPPLQFSFLFFGNLESGLKNEWSYKREICGSDKAACTKG